jgi:hypothetical protein
MSTLGSDLRQALRSIPVRPQILALSLSLGMASAKEPQVTPAVLNSVQAYLEGTPSSLSRSLHPELTRTTLRRFKTRTVLERMGAASLIGQYSTGTLPPGHLGPRASVRVVEIHDGLASVTVGLESKQVLLHLARLDDGWKIIHILCGTAKQEASTAPAPGNPAAIRACVEDYYSNDPERVERALHPELSKVRPARLEPPGTWVMERMGASALVELVRDYPSQMAPTSPPDISILDHLGDLVALRVTSGKDVDLIHAAKLDGQWKIVHVLWQCHQSVEPKAPLRSGLGQAKITREEIPVRLTWDVTDI